MSLCFHIIYTPGSVQPLLFLVHSLLQWSDCTFRLVANGCTEGETQQLAAFCQNNSRLHFIRLPTARMLGHGQALNYLQAVNDADYFCFMDSDIYATGDFVSEFAPHLSAHVGVFSGAPIEQPPEGMVMPDGYPMLDGRFNRTKTGLCLGSTYFAIYNNRQVTMLRRASGVGFEGYHWAKIPASIQQQCQVHQLVYPRYDTARVLNLLFHLQGGETLFYQPATYLRHLGGLSRLTNVYAIAWRRRLKIYAYQLLHGKRPRLSQEYFAQAVPYFVEFLQALHAQRPLPLLPPLEDAATVARVQQATVELCHLYQEVVP